jgi:cell shape-determining protein MreD
MTSLINNVQDRFKTSSNALALLAFRLLSGVVLGLTLSLIGQEIIGYEMISFTLITLIVVTMFVRITKSWTWTHIFIFDLICILIGLLLRMYILIAPGA